MRPFGRRARRSRPSCLGILSVFSALLLGGATRADAQTPWTWAGYFENVTSPGGPPASPTPADGASRMSRHPVSQDGRFVVFETEAANLGAPQGVSAIYRRDRITGQLTIVQMGFVRNAAISADGGHVAFEQCATGFTSPCQIYAKNLATAAPPVLMSTTASGFIGNGDSTAPTLSGNGRFLVYVTNANVLSGDSLRRKQIMWRDRDPDADGIYDESGALVQVVTVIGPVIGNGDSDTPEVSDDGRLIAFRSAATNLVGGDTNGVIDVFQRDRSFTTVRRLNLRPGNVQSPAPIVEPHISMSGNGQFVAFASADPFLAPSSVADTNGTLDVFLYQGTPTVLRVDVGRSNGLPAPGNGPTGWATLNSDGRYLSLQSAATNAPFLAPTGSVQVYAVDRQLQTVARISGMPDGTEPDAPSVQPSITAGGSLVVFSSSATTFTGMAAPAFPQIHAAARLNVTPAAVTLPASGGQAGVRISAHTFTRLQPYVEADGTWLSTSLALSPPDNNWLTIDAPANDGAERSTVIHVGTRIVTVTQPAAVTITSVSPNVGPVAGGNTVTISGSGFGPDALVFFGEVQVPWQFVDANTLAVTAPAWSTAEQVTLRVEFSPWNRAWAMDGYTFVYVDDTPPTLVGHATGPLGQDGWFVGDVQVTWAMDDSESPITATTCTTIAVTGDTTGTTFACTATSAGGTTTASVFVKRDATPPAIAVTSPRVRQLVEPGALLTADFTCADPVSGVEICGFTAPSGALLDTQAPGWHQFVPAARDAAGNMAAPVVEYAVSGSVCTAPVEGLKHWNRFEDNLVDTMFWIPAFHSQPSTLVYGPGVAGRAYQLASGSGRLEIHSYQNLTLTSGLSLAVWLEPGTDAVGTVLDRLSQFGLRRDAAGTITWTLSRPGGGTETGTSTGVVSTGAWTHVALTYDAGVVTLYLNGRADGTWTVDLPTLEQPSAPDIHVGGPMYYANPYIGKLDELQLFDRGIAPADVEAIFLSGSAGTCRPAATTLTVLPSTATFGDATFQSVAILRDANGQPVVGRTLRLDQLAVPYGTMPPGVELVTDADGRVTWDAPFTVGVGYYYTAVRARFRGDLAYSYTPWVSSTLNVRAAPTEVTWTAPAPIVYGAPLSAAQLNATGSGAGSYSYTPMAGTVLPVGMHTLQVWFYPSASGYASSTTTVTIEVGKAVPTMVLANTTLTYNGQPRPVTAAARDYRNYNLSPVTVTYDGASTAPSAVGVYTVVASFPGDANHQPNSATATLTITKAAPTISFSTPASFTYDGQPHGVVATVTGVGGAVLGTVPVTYQGIAGVPIDAGSYVASATFDGNGSYTAGTATTTVTIARALPSVAFAPLPATFTYSGQPPPLTATVTGVGGADLGTVAVSYWGSATPPVDVGLYSASASFAGNANYLPVSRSTAVTIQKATPSIVFAPQPTSFTYDGQPHPLTAAVVGVDGASLGTAPVAYSHSGTAPVAVGAYTASATFGGNANYTSHTASTPITITASTPLVTVSGGPFVYNAWGHGATVTVTGVGGQTVVAAVTVTYDGSPVLPINAGTYTVVASVAASGNYAAASATGTLVIEPATPPIYWLAPNPITYGTPLDNRHLGAHSHVAGTWTYTPAAGTVLDVGLAQPLTVAFTPTDPNYVPATATRTIDVQRATPFVSVLAEFYTYDGQPHPAIHPKAFGVGNVMLTPLAVTYNGLPEAPVSAGTYTITATFDGDARHTPATGTATLTIHKASPGVTWHPQVSIGYGTPLGPAHLNATAPIPGTFSYSPAAGTILDASAPQAHTIRATFTPDDSLNYAVQIVPVPIWVYRASPMVRAFGGGFVYDGQPHAGSGTATGIGGVELTPVTVTYNDSPEVPVAAGTYTVRATFEGNTNYSPNSHTTILTIARAPVTLTWAAPASLPYGPTLSATQLNAQASVPGTFSYSPGLSSRLPAGTHALTATFTPTDTANYASGGTVTTSITIVPAPLEVRTIDTAKAFGAPVPAFTASYTGLVSGQTVAVLSGTLVFATTATANSPAGAYAVTPAGLSSPNYAISFVAGTLSILKAPVDVTLNASPAPSGLDMPITFSATVAAAQSAPTAPTGTVRFFDGATLLGTATLSGGTATLLTGGLTAGSHTIEARYDGDTSFDAGSRTATHVVNAAAATPAITLTTSRQPASITQSMTFTATITVATAGTIAFYDGAILLGSGSIASGRATLFVANLAAGSHAITARFQGNASAPPVISPVLVQSITLTGWKDRTSTVALVSSGNPSALGATVTFTATASGSSGTPTGRILFMVDGLVAGDPTGVAMTSGQASVQVPSLNGGRHKVTATYLGSSNYRGSNGALTQTVN